VWQGGGAYRGWRLAIASIRIGVAETIANAGSFPALRVGIEVSPYWLW
jgi:hypothetical protein